MRILVLTTRSRNVDALLVLGIIWTVSETVVCDEVKGNVSEVDVGATNGTARNSRQLWTLVKNVIKTGLEHSGGGAGGNSPAGGLGTLAGLFGSAIANGVGNEAGHQNQYYQQQGYNPQNVNPSQFANPNDYMHYLLANSQSNQHSSLPHYFQKQQKEQESAQELVNKYREQMASGSENVETGGGSTGSQLLNKLAFGTLFDDLDKVTNFLSFARFEGMFEKINKFDKLKCIPRLLCQMVSKRVEDQKKEEEKKKAKEREDSTSTTTRRPTNRKADDEDDEGDEKKSRKEDDGEVDKDLESKEEKKRESEEEDDEGEEDDDDEDDSDEIKEYVVIKKGAEEKEETKGGKKKGEGRTGRFLKLNGGDVALEQFVKFLELMQLKDWSLYPYVNGAYQGHQVTRAEECAYRFASCPFSDEQLVYYFNNYNGGFFQSI